MDLADAAHQAIAVAITRAWVADDSANDAARAVIAAIRGMSVEDQAKLVGAQVTRKYADGAQLWRPTA